MSVAGWIAATIARLRAGGDDPALRAAEERTHEATKHTHPALSNRHRRADIEAGSEYLGARITRAYPTTFDARLRPGADHARDYDGEQRQAANALARALEDTWEDGLSFGRWVERAAARVGV